MQSDYNLVVNEKENLNNMVNVLKGQMQDQLAREEEVKRANDELHDTINSLNATIIDLKS